MLSDTIEQAEKLYQRIDAIDTLLIELKDVLSLDFDDYEDAEDIINDALEILEKMED